MNIVCIGDSFTYGDELANPKTCAWPALLGNLLSSQVVNLGHNGCSNSRIIKRAIDCTFEKIYDIIIVVWSNPQRMEICDKKGVFTYWASRNIKFIEDSDRVDLVKSLAVNDCENLHRWSHRRWLRDIILLQSFFKQNNQKYLMIQSHESQYMNRRWIVESDRHAQLSQHVDTMTFLGWPLDGIVEWAHDCPRGTHGHPLELGQQKIAKKIDEYIRNIGWLP